MKRKIILQSFLISLFTLTALFIASIIAFYSSQANNIKDTLIELTATLEPVVKKDVSLLDDLSLENTRITIVDMQGNVVFDSSTDNYQIFDNHLDREEIVNAMNGSPAVVKRYSQSLGCNMYYYAKLVNCDNGETYIVRLAQKEKDIWTYTGLGIFLIAITIIISLVVSYLFASKLSAKVTNQLTSLRDGLRNINSGDYDNVTFQTNNALNLSILNEMNELVKNLQDNYNNAQNEKTKLYNIIDNMTQGVIVVNSIGEIVLINNVASLLFGNAQPKNLLSGIISDKKLYELITKALNSEQKEAFAYTFADKELKITAFDILINNSNDFLGIILISDVTKEKELSKQKSIFFANASHELKTPLTSVQGLSESLLARTDDNSPSYKYLKRIYTESIRLHNIVMDMLYISKLEGKSIDKNHENISIAKLCEDSYLSYGKEIEQKGITINIQGDAHMVGDVHNIYECITNLIGNAIHYNKQNGSVDIKLFDEDDKARIIISDTGIGIAPQHLPHICERFYRVDKSRSKSTGGTGLGLAIVKHIVALYNGTLDIKSTLDAGTTITVVFPKEPID